MHRLLLLPFCILFYFPGISQNIDSLLSVPQTLELRISTPQPRLREVFKITLDATYLRAQIFRSTLGKVTLAENLGSTENGLMSFDVSALNKGKNEIGPLQFNMNGTHYSTNKVEYEVVDALPNVDKGVWMRKVKLSDSTFCIIIEQRIPAKPKTSVHSANSVTYSTEAEHTNILKFKDSYSIQGLSRSNSYINTSYGSIVSDGGEEKQFLSAYAVYYFKIEDESAPIVITKDKFDNIPEGYTVESIVIHSH